MIDRLKELDAQRKPLNAKSMEEFDITLITAARRRFDSWDKALTAAGINYKDHVLRTPFKRKRKELSDKPVLAGAAA